MLAKHLRTADALLPQCHGLWIEVRRRRFVKPHLRSRQCSILRPLPEENQSTVAETDVGDQLVQRRPQAVAEGQRRHQQVGQLQQQRPFPGREAQFLVQLLHGLPVMPLCLELRLLGRGSGLNGFS